MLCWAKRKNNSFVRPLPRRVLARPCSTTRGAPAASAGAAPGPRLRGLDGGADATGAEAAEAWRKHQTEMTGQTRASDLGWMSDTPQNDASDAEAELVQVSDLQRPARVFSQALHPMKMMKVMQVSDLQDFRPIFRKQMGQANGPMIRMMGGLPPSKRQSKRR